MHLDEERPERRRVGALDWCGGLALRATDRAFGGLSGLDVAADGRTLLAVTDRGAWVHARLVHGPDGEMRGIQGARIGDLPALPGVAGRWKADAEAMAPVPGGIVVAFEGTNRLVEYRLDPSGAPTAGARGLATPRGFDALDGNGGIEGLARLADGRLLAIAEGESDKTSHAEAWIGWRRAWTARRFETGGRFRPTGAARGPDGRIFVLERRFSWLGGLASRIKVVDASAFDGDADAPVRGRTLAVVEPPLPSENFEGIAARRDARGRTVLYLVSDDNFNALQRNLILCFRLD